MSKQEYKETDWVNYRRLEKGEMIIETDETLIDGKGWRQTICTGQPAPDPNFTSHRWYRRQINTSS